MAILSLNPWLLWSVLNKHKPRIPTACGSHNQLSGFLISYPQPASISETLLRRKFRRSHYFVGSENSYSVLE